MARDVDTDSPSDSIGRFAADLRALRLDAESPTLARLQNDAGISKSVLSEAFAGRQLPSARTVDRLVRALGADAPAWVRRRDELARAGAAAAGAEGAVGSGSAGSAGAGSGGAGTAGAGDGADAASLVLNGQDAVAASTPTFVAPVGTMRRRTAFLLIAAAFVVGILVAGGVSLGVSATAVSQARADGAAAARHELTDSPVNPRAQINVHNGVDPAMTPCVNDAEVATSASRAHNTLIEIIWSNKCYAGWARITRYDEKFSGNSMTVAIYPETAAQGPDRQSATEPNVESAYTTLVVRPTPQTRLCAVGVITLDGESIDLGEPLCT
ncbi:DUF2690 domain-containing protein [Microbacterium sp. KR10-403]|uniref:DUF2690 domain-containing protein n=1 Tax=Microbacterium sp. KR10-403 TaxID=3158581 RepID=UPI0032E3CBB3